MDLIFKTAPVVILAGNRFVNVPVILQYESTPLVEVVSSVSAGYEAQFSIYHEDGTYLAKVVGSRLLETPEGRKAGVTLRHPDKMTVCELNGRPIVEIARSEAAALKTQAELFCPDGHLIKSTDRDLTHLLMKGRSDAPLNIGGLYISGSSFEGCRIGIHVTKNGIGIGCN
jgi:hypothetical protein